METIDTVKETVKEVKSDVKSTITTKYLVGVGIGLTVLFATVWVAGRAWKKSQKA